MRYLLFEFSYVTVGLNDFSFDHSFTGFNSSRYGPVYDRVYRIFQRQYLASGLFTSYVVVPPLREAWASMRFNLPQSFGLSNHTVGMFIMTELTYKNWEYKNEISF